jgi:3-deoxy-D-manno-octulosonic-acid transferase
VSDVGGQTPSMFSPLMIQAPGRLATASATDPVRGRVRGVYESAIPTLRTGRDPSMRLTLGERLYRAAAPFVFSAIWRAAQIAGESAGVLQARRGHLPAGGRSLLWFHGASAGEVYAAARLANALRGAGYTFTPGFTAANAAGLSCAARTVEALSGVAAMVPWDVPRWVARAFDLWRPAALFLVETELWPVLIFEAARRRVPVFSVSARIYPRDVRRYAAVPWVTAPMLQRLTAILAQNDEERERFVRLGARPERCVVAGNLKYIDADVAGSGVANVALGIPPGAPLVVCGSVHADEAMTVLDALHELPASTRIVVAPRQPEEGGVMEAAARCRGWRVFRRSAGPLPADWQVLVLDTIGELAAVYSQATVAVVGGGFGAHGGHNPFEAVVAGAPVAFGPHFEHFKEEAAALLAAAPEALVCDGNELARRVRQWVTQPAVRQDVVMRQQQRLPDGAAIRDRYLTWLTPWLNGASV